MRTGAERGAGETRHAVVETEELGALRKADITRMVKLIKEAGIGAR